MTQDVKTQLLTCCGCLLCALELAVKNTASEVPHADFSGRTAQNFLEQEQWYQQVTILSFCDCLFALVCTTQPISPESLFITFGWGLGGWVGLISAFAVVVFMMV